MGDMLGATELGSHLEGDINGTFPHLGLSDHSVGREAPTLPESSVAEAIIDAGRNRALELASLFAAQAGHATGLPTETSKRKRDDGTLLEAPDLKRPAGDGIVLRLPDDSGSAPTLLPLPTTDGHISETFMCPPDKVGRIIGRAGSTIRDVETSTGTRVQVDHKATGDKPVLISGRREDVERAKRIIQDLISGTTESMPPGSAELQEVVECPPAIVGRVIGRGGETIRTLQQASGAHILVNQDFPDGVQRQIVITGGQEAVQRAVSMVTELINGDHANTQTIIQRFGVGSTEVLECPKAMVGRIIGKGGETIKDLQKRFNASIQIDQGSTPCKITITGPSQMLTAAKRAIEELLRTTTTQPAGGPRPGPSFGASYAHPPYAVPSGPYGPYGGFGVPSATYATPNSYSPYGGYSPYPNTVPPYGNYGGYGTATTDSYGSAASYNHQGYTPAVPQTIAGASMQPSAGVGSLWQALQDDQGRTYYYNSVTGVSQWEKPADMP